MAALASGLPGRPRLMQWEPTWRVHCSTHVVLELLLGEASSMLEGELHPARVMNVHSPEVVGSCLKGREMVESRHYQDVVVACPLADEIHSHHRENQVVEEVE